MSKMMKIAICPFCGEELVQDECYGEDSEKEYIAYFMLGHCPYCKKEFQWVELYGYEGVEDIEVVD